MTHIDPGPSLGLWQASGHRIQSDKIDLEMVGIQKLPPTDAGNWLVISVDNVKIEILETNVFYLKTTRFHEKGILDPGAHLGLITYFHSEC